MLWTHQTARPKQLPPDGDWRIFLAKSGRGWGKTRVGAEWLIWQAIKYDNTRWAVVAPTFGDARDTCVEGDSGLLSVANRYGVLKAWNRSLGEIKLTNGSRIKLFSAEEPQRLRGPQHHGAWVDELASFRYPDAFDQLQFGLRLGRDKGIRPQTIITTTPRPTKLFLGLLNRDDTVIVTGSMKENEANLSDDFVKDIVNKYGGTRLGRQEIEGEVLLDVPGALWTLDLIDAQRVNEVPEMVKIVVAVDPAVTSTEDSDETGIIVAGRGVDGRGYLLDDMTCRLSPSGWAARVVEAYDKWQANLVVGETNQGGDMIRTLIQQHKPNVPYRGVVARVGKRLRAEPISSLYEQGRVSHVGSFDLLENQMCSWVDGESDFSPDRLDALVHAFTELGIANANSAVDAFIADFIKPCPGCGANIVFDAAQCKSCGLVVGETAPHNLPQF